MIDSRPCRVNLPLEAPGDYLLACVTFGTDPDEFTAAILAHSPTEGWVAATFRADGSLLDLRVYDSLRAATLDYARRSAALLEGYR